MAQLCQHLEELERLNTDVLLVSFSSREHAHIWITEVCSTFTLLIDRERASYRTYGLDSSVLRSWSLKTVWSYVKLLRAGRKWQGIQGNSTQLGGDFVVDAEGIVRLAYRSHDPTDRPPVTDLLAVLRRIEEAS